MARMAPACYRAAMHCSTPIARLGILAALLCAPARAAPPELSAADRAWIDTCVAQLKAEPAPNEAVKQRYCACMHEQFDDNPTVTQSEMEHMFPPLHRACNRESGWK
ncbi:MAG: hypothetical protein GC182_06755 [Rhodopseudomonas sp.]|nr:hypothetical protein [Rhodopseudomonas sp.]